jgi:hypothetical protein
VSEQETRQRKIVQNLRELADTNLSKNPSKNWQKQIVLKACTKPSENFFVAQGAEFRKCQAC